MTRHRLKQMHANVGASAHARATTSREVGQGGAAETRAKIHKATVVPPVSPRARTLAPTLKSELWQRSAGVVIGNRSPARIGAYHSIFGRTECAGKLLATANRLSIRQAVAGVLEHGSEPPRDCRSGAYLSFSKVA
jgi:hypothetical protein